MEGFIYTCKHGPDWLPTFSQARAGQESSQYLDIWAEVIDFVPACVFQVEVGPS